MLQAAVRGPVLNKKDLKITIEDVFLVINGERKEGGGVPTMRETKDGTLRDTASTMRVSCCRMTPRKTRSRLR